METGLPGSSLFVMVLPARQLLATRLPLGAAPGGTQLRTQALPPGVPPLLPPAVTVKITWPPPGGTSETVLLQQLRFMDCWPMKQTLQLAWQYLVQTLDLFNSLYHPLT